MIDEGSVRNLLHAHFEANRQADMEEEIVERVIATLDAVIAAGGLGVHTEAVTKARDELRSRWNEDE